MSEPLVIIGNGMAAAKLVEELAKTALGRYAVAVIGEEPELAYNRVLLSSVLAGEMKSSDAELEPARWWRDRGVTLRYGCKAMAIDISAREVLLADGARIAFSKLVLATGSQAVRLPVPGSSLAGVHTFRDSADVDALAKLARDRKTVAVIGGGLLGLEAAYGLAQRGAHVTLVHVMDRLMERQLDAAGAALLQRLVEEKGVRVLLGAQTVRIIGDEKVEGLEFSDGATIEAEAVVFAVGVRPQVELAREGGIPVNRGILVNDQMETAVDGVFAIGECAEHDGVCYGLVEPAYEQARALATHLGGRAAKYRGSVVSTNLKVSGVRVFSAGDFNGGPGAQQIVLSDRRMGVYKKLIVEGDHLVGAVLIGDTAGALTYLDLIRRGVAIGADRDTLMFRALLQEAA